MIAGGGKELSVLLEVVDDKISTCSDLALVAVGLTTWFQATTASASSNALTFTSAGIGETTVGLIPRLYVHAGD